MRDVEINSEGNDIMDGIRTPCLGAYPRRILQSRRDLKSNNRVRIIFLDSKERKMYSILTIVPMVRSRSVSLIVSIVTVV